MTEHKQTDRVSSRTDTLPSTPPSIDTEDRKSSPRIFIDTEGVHDFDFKKRPPSGSNKLKKFGRRSIRSISSMADIEPVERHPSTGSENSIRKRFSAILHPTQQNQQAQDEETTSQQEPPPCDPLPDTRKELETRLNYHLAELDMLRKTIRSANDVIRHYTDRYYIFQTRGTADMQESMRRQLQMIKQARKNRDSYGSFVGYHQRELERIKHKRVEIERAAGLEPTLPEVYKNLWTDDDWALLFRP